MVRAGPDDGTVTEHPDPAPSVRREYRSAPQERMFTAPGGEKNFAGLRSPANSRYRAPDGELPPDLLNVHGGPAGRAFPVLDPDFSLFTSRGTGVVAVTYGGSTGSGRRYRERRRAQWGGVDFRHGFGKAAMMIAAGEAELSFYGQVSGFTPPGIPVCGSPVRP